jgi:flavodoxin
VAINQCALQPQIKVMLMLPANILVVYYSRTGNTRRLAQAIASAIHCDIEEISEVRERSGLVEFIKSFFEAIRGHHAPIETVGHDPAAYNLLVVGTPVWAGSVSTPIRSYLASQKNGFPDVAFFCTLEHAGSDGAFAEMQSLVGKVPRARCAVKANDVAAGNFEGSVNEFVRQLGV